MRLFKNVDICDLESIMAHGILSLNECDNNNWGEGKRSQNSCDVVYLFSPLTHNNSFPKYGVALIEVDVDACKNQMAENDHYYGIYEEYAVEKVDVKYIKNIYIPDIFKHRINLPDFVSEKIVWCGMRAKHYDEINWGLVECDCDTLRTFSETAELLCSNTFNFFRGENKDRTMIDLYDIQYIINC